MPECTWRLFRFSLPLAMPLPSGASVRQGWLVQLQGAGATGWGEVAPLPGFSRETPEAAFQALQALLPRLTSGPEASTFAEWAETVASLLADAPASVRWGLELALASWQAARAGKRLDTWLASDPLPVISINALVPTDWQAHPECLATIRTARYRTVKVKVSGHTPDEAARCVQQLRDMLGSEITLRVDANRAWTLREALAFAEAVADLKIAYIEEPLRDPEKLQEFVCRSPVPVALDETLAEQPGTPLHRWEGVAAVVLKPLLLGGLLSAWRRAEEARALGMAVVWSAAFETGIGTRGLLALAAASRSTAAAGLDPYRWLADDVLHPRLAWRPEMSVGEALAGPWHPNPTVLETIDVVA
ncbi:o-succinylbenzoate synthase [Rhodothermus marinus]|uniref:o-succinylbenzoate synthase n=1 Tax=Rhodothermus marinus TaxID=29549 RepID=UPI0012BA429B|nr:o-succinylbenzoate synthase [Rhodothermus marinus]BBM68768.1 o-succinylbenzoate synthase [Rhodothermus marinus]